MTEKKPTLFDIEVFGGNFFCISLKTLYQKLRRRFVIFHDTQGTRHINQMEEMLDYFQDECSTLISYNGDGYDNIILHYIIKNRNKFSKSPVHEVTRAIKQINDDIINGGKLKRKNPQYKEPKYISDCRKMKSLQTFDILRMFNTVDKTSLKQIGINMKCPKLQDLPFDPAHIVLYEEIPTIMIYNDNDVDVLEELVRRKSKDIKERVELGPVFGLDVRQENDTNIAKKLLEKYYRERTGINLQTFRGKGTFYKTFSVNECISKKVHFLTPQYIGLLDEMRMQHINPNVKSDKKKKRTILWRQEGYGTVKLKEFEYVVKSKYCQHTIAKGGIHSENIPEIIEECDKYEIWDLDASSFYPFMMLLEELYPKHLGREFLAIFRWIVEERIRAKKAGEAKANFLKIAANSVYGLTNSLPDAFYDPKVTFSTCINGELMLLMLIERLEMLSNCVVIYSNTDGLTVKVPKEEKHIFDRVCKDWQNYTGFELEFKRYKKIVINGVNSYYIEYYDKNKQGEQIIDYKLKGDFATEIQLTKGYYYPVVAKALFNYYKEGKSVYQSIVEETDIYNFMKAERVNNETFDVLVRLKNTRKERYLQKTNRWVATKNQAGEGMGFKKNKEDDKETALEKDRFIYIMNDVPTGITPKEISLDIQFYEFECYKVIGKIKKLNRPSIIKKTISQLTLSGLEFEEEVDDIDFGFEEEITTPQFEEYA